MMKIEDKIASGIIVDISTGGMYSTQYLILLPDGTQKWFSETLLKRKN